MNEKLATLHEYVDMGWSIMPVMENKQPNFEWKDLPVAPKEQITDWFNQGATNWAVLTGERSGIFIVDVDIAGKAAFGKLVSINKLGETRIVGTPSGGRHIYCKNPKDMRLTNFSGSFPHGVDIRGNGGYALIPPSSGYQLLMNKPIIEAPNWILEKLESKPFVEIAASNAVIPEGNRNTSLYAISCNLLRLGLVDSLHELVEVINDIHVNPPLEEKELRSIVKSALKNV